MVSRSRDVQELLGLTDDENEEWLDLFSSYSGPDMTTVNMNDREKAKKYIEPAQEFFLAYNVQVLDVRDSTKHPGDCFEWLVRRS